MANWLKVSSIKFQEVPAFLKIVIFVKDVTGFVVKCEHTELIARLSTKVRQSVIERNITN